MKLRSDALTTIQSVLTLKIALTGIKIVNKNFVQQSLTNPLP